MKVFWLLFRSNTHKSLLVVFLGLLSGAASTGLIATANSSLYSNTATGHARWLLALAFMAAVLLKVASTAASGLVLGRSMQEITLNMCEGLCRKVSATPLPRLEEIGGPRVMACLTDDIEILSQAIQTIPTLVIDLAMLVGCAIYIAWISPLAALGLTILTVLVAVPYRMIMVKAHTAIKHVRDSRDTLFQHFRSLVDGIKEIKLNNERKNAFLHEDLDGTAQRIRKQYIVALNRYIFAEGWSQLTYFSLLGVVLFGFPILHHVSLKTLTAYVFIALYMMGPIAGAAAAVPYFVRGKASLDKLDELGMALGEISGGAVVQDSESKAKLKQIAALRTPPRIDFRNVVFQRAQDKGNPFKLGPIDLTLHPGELVFIIGGNGSGKSTLAKLMTGLYPPNSGEILVDGIPVTAESEDAYRQLYSTVFSDFYLFNRLLGLNQSPEWSERTTEYLDALELSEVVKLDGDSFSTTALSQGQRRRMALLVAYLEDRPIYVLDEWAADQDPEFRKIFYLKLLPELKEKGKTVVLITHDDRFFHLGDRVIKLEYGKVVETIQQAETASTVRS